MVPPERGPERGLSVLLVEDETPVARALARLLSLDDHRVAVVHDGRAALDALATGTYDLVLCDIRMPVLDGMGVYRELDRLESPMRGRIGFITAGSANPDIEEFFDKTRVPWITKPAALDDVRDLIRRIRAR